MLQLCLLHILDLENMQTDTVYLSPFAVWLMDDSRHKYNDLNLVTIPDTERTIWIAN